MLSGRFDADNYPSLGATLAALGVGQAQFFVNSVNTRTQGLDLTVAHKGELGRGKLNTFLAFNYSKTRVTGVKTPASLAGFEDVLLSERERLFIEQGGPRMKATLGFDHALGPWETSLKVIHFGSQTLGTFSGTAAGVPNARYAPKTSADLALTYAFDKNTKVTIGGNNIFNVKPANRTRTKPTTASSTTACSSASTVPATSSAFGRSSSRPKQLAVNGFRRNRQFNGRGARFDVVSTLAPFRAEPH